MQTPVELNKELKKVHSPHVVEQTAIGAAATVVSLDHIDEGRRLIQHKCEKILVVCTSTGADCYVNSSGNASVFAARSVVPPLQSATPILTIRPTSMTMSLSKFSSLKCRLCKVSPGAAALPRPPPSRRRWSTVNCCLHMFVVRLYDVNTFQCFVASNPNDQHTGPITAVLLD